MNKVDELIDDEPPAEHELRDMAGAVRGKYAARLAQECNVVMIDEDLTKIFPNQQAVNDALRFLLNSGMYPASKTPPIHK